MSRRSLSVFTAGALGAILLAAGSTVAIAAGNGAFDRVVGSHRCVQPVLHGTIVHVALSDTASMMGGPMMGPMVGPMMRGMFRITVDQSRVPAGSISLTVTNRGAMTHELLVLPLAGRASPGSREVLGNGRVDERSSVGEASRTCGEGEGDGIRSGARSWVTLTLTSGRYEIVCNLPGHYAAGMYAEVDVA